MTGAKRARSAADKALSLAATPPARKRQRLTHIDADAETDIVYTTTPTSPRDHLTRLSDELLLRILSFLPLHHLLAVAPVSRRLYSLASDSQLWKALYYSRFVLPRAMRIPGFRDGAAGSGTGTGSGAGAGHRLHYAGRRTLWADGRRGGVVMRGDERRAGETGRRDGLGGGQEEEENAQDGAGPLPVNWKRQYKIRHNWARGKCAVEELRLGRETDVEEEDRRGRKMLVKVVEGVAVTADRDEGLRAWDLKSRSLVAQIGIAEYGSDATPSCIAVDEARSEQGVLDVALGFDDGSFGVWTLATGKRRMALRYRHAKSSNGELIAMAFSYPYLLTATQAVLVSLYTFNVPSTSSREAPAGVTTASANGADGTGKLSPPYLLTSLDSHTSRPPLALSIRKAGKTTIASVAYTFSTRRGWSLGIQDLHICQASTDGSAADTITSRLAYTNPIETEGTSHLPLTPRETPRRRAMAGAAEPGNSPGAAGAASEQGPTTLCYTHPYLLATLPDNTLVLHLCTSSASSLAISDGIRLWGHTSGISDAEITARGKAVSVSTRGDEMRVWELEGRSAGAGGRSVEIRPWGQSMGPGGNAAGGPGLELGDPARDWDERRNWVGFDDEMVIVLKERRGARQSLMVYDFT